MQSIVLVAIGGAIGSCLRHLVNVAALRLFGPAYPWGTVTVNIVGCMAMGIFVEALARRWGASQELRLLVATGVLGGFTTFSAFALDFAVLWERGPTTGLGYGLLSVLGSLFAIFAGLWLARALL